MPLSSLVSPIAGGMQSSVPVNASGALNPGWQRLGYVNDAKGNPGRGVMGDIYVGPGGQLMVSPGAGPQWGVGMAMENGQPMESAFRPLSTAEQSFYTPQQLNNSIPGAAKAMQQAQASSGDGMLGSVFKGIENSPFGVAPLALGTAVAGGLGAFSGLGSSLGSLTNSVSGLGETMGATAPVTTTAGTGGAILGGSDAGAGLASGFGQSIVSPAAQLTGAISGAGGGAVAGGAGGLFGSGLSLGNALSAGSLAAALSGGISSDGSGVNDAGPVGMQNLPDSPLSISNIDPLTGLTNPSVAGSGTSTGTGSIWDQLTNVIKGVGGQGTGAAGAYSPNLGGILGGVIGAIGSSQASDKYAEALKYAADKADPFAASRPQYQQLFSDLNTGAKNINDTPWMQSLNNTITDNTAQRLSSKYGGDVSSLGVRNAITGQVAAQNTPVAMSYLNQIGNAAGANIAPMSGQILANGAQNQYNNSQQTAGNLGAASNALLNGNQQSTLQQLYNLNNNQPTQNQNLFQAIGI